MTRVLAFLIIKLKLLEMNKPFDLWSLVKVRGKNLTF